MLFDELNDLVACLPSRELLSLLQNLEILWRVWSAGVRVDMGLIMHYLLINEHVFTSILLSLMHCWLHLVFLVMLMLLFT